MADPIVATEDLSQNPFYQAADNYELSAGKQSIFSQAIDVATKGTLLTGVSIVRSFWNTGKMVGSWATGQKYEESAAEDWIKAVDYSGDMFQYYKAHEMGIEAAGLIAGSFIPGTIAAKGIKLASQTKAAGAFGRMMGYQDNLIQEAQAFNTAGKSITVFDEINKAKFAGIAAGFGEQAVIAAGWEIATIATMKANPTISADGFGEAASHVFYGALTGGIIGGAFSGFVMNGVLKKAMLNADQRARAEEVFNDMGMGKFIAGDRAAMMLKSVDDMVEAATQKGTTELDTANRTFDRARQAASAVLAKIVPDTDQGVQDELLNFMLKARTEGQMSNEQVYDKLAGLGKIRRIDMEDAPERVLARKMEAFELIKQGNSEGLVAALELKLEELTSPRIINIFSGKETTSAHAVIGDLGKNIRLTADQTALVVGEGKATYTFQQAAPWEGFSTALNAESPIDAVARFVYAAERDIKDHVDFSAGKGIQVSDLPFMEQLVRSWDKKYSGNETARLAINLLDETGKKLEGDWAALGGFDRTEISRMLLEQKQKIAAELIARGKDMDEVALRTNVPVQTLEDGSLFAATRPQDVKLFMRDINELKSTNHVAIQYEAGLARDIDGNVMQGMVHVQRRIEDAMNHSRTVLSKYLAETGSKNPDAFVADMTAYQADILGASPRFFGNRDPDPKSLAARVQNMGAAFKDHLSKLTQEAFDELTPHINGLKAKPAAGAEQALLDNIMRGTGEKYQLFHPNQAAPRSEVGAPAIEYAKMQAILRNAGFNPDEYAGFLVRRASIEGNKITTSNIADPSFVNLSDQLAGSAGKYVVYPIQHSETVNFMAAHSRINNARRIHHANWLNATGQVNKAEETINGLGSYYAPAMDTSKYKHVVFVKETDRLNGSSRMHAVVSPNLDSMQTKIKAIQEQFPEYEVFTREQLKREFKNRGEYEFDKDMQSTTINSALTRKGIVSDLIPDLNVDNLSDNYLRWHAGQTRRQLANFTELGNSQLFAELRHLGEQYSDLAASRVGSTSAKILGKQEKNPFQEYIDTALDISPRYHFPLWQDANQKAEALYNGAFNKASSIFRDAQAGLVDWGTASAMTERLGLGNPYKNMDALAAVSERLPPSQLAGLVRTGNSVIAATQVRLDTFQSLINIVSTPILLLAQASSARFAALKEATSVGVPGSEHVMPSGTKAMFRAVSNFWGKDKDALLQTYKDKGFIPDINTIKGYHAMVEDLASAPGSSKFSEKLGGAVDKAAKYSGANFAEEFTRFVTADSGRQLYEAQGLVGEELWTAVRTFVNRVQGNYVASQRPVVFQGVLGQAVGLFQTYQFNLMQQLFRFVEEGDKRTLAVLAGMQGSLYGLQGMPGFNILNTHIVGNAAGNANHNDVFTGVNSYAGKDVADYLLYGSLSNILQTGLYARGDINPRQVTVLPINPLDWPAISGARRFLDNIKNTTGQMANGAPVFDALLYGIEHNGLSRPLSGAAQLIKGESTTAGNALVQAVDWNDMANASRIFGSKPLDEAIGMDALFRKSLYDAVDQDRLKKLGSAVRNTMLGGGSPSEEELTTFQSNYAASGGRPERFGSFIAESSKKANIAAVNDVMYHLNNPKAQQIYRLMDGEPLSDYTNMGSTQVAPAQ